MFTFSIGDTPNGSVEEKEENNGSAVDVAVATILVSPSLPVEVESLDFGVFMTEHDTSPIGSMG